MYLNKKTTNIVRVSDFSPMILQNLCFSYYMARKCNADVKRRCLPPAKGQRDLRAGADKQRDIIKLAISVASMLIDLSYPEMKLVHDRALLLQTYINQT